MRWFDLKGMSKYLDWFNFMRQVSATSPTTFAVPVLIPLSYDIHGVWDSTNKFSGPYVRPHTNLTEIKQGLDLLWRNSVDPQKVNMGLAWYGRSFTLANSACNKPGCVFNAGGSPGQCTKSAGTLSNAEIFRQIATGHYTVGSDTTAAVKWITYNTTQWVSYDNGVTMQQKISAANNLCLG